MRKPSALSLVVVLALLIAAAPAGAATAREGLVVDRESLGGHCSNGRDLAAVSDSLPLCSIDAALKLAPPNSTITVRRGSYPELNVDSGFDSAGLLTLRAAPGEHPTISGLRTRDTTGLQLSGFHIAGQVILERSHSIALVGNDISPRGVSVRVGSSDIRIERNRIHDLDYQAEQFNGGYGVLLAGGGGGIRDVTIRDNTISGIPIDGIQVTSVTGLLIEDNEITEVHKPAGTGVHSDSIQLLGGTDVTIRSNMIHGNSHGIMNTNNPMPRLTIDRNVIVNITGGFGVMLVGAGPATIANNTLWDTQYGLVLRDDSHDVTVKGNVLDRYDGGQSHLAAEDGNLIAVGQSYGENDIHDVPSFVNPDALDYRLSPGSPGADAGLGANRGG